MAAPGRDQPPLLKSQEQIQAHFPQPVQCWQRQVSQVVRQKEKIDVVQMDKVQGI